MLTMPCRNTYNMTTSNTILEQITEDFPDETFLYPTGYEDCVIGLEQERWVLIMDSNKIIERLISEDGMTDLDAQEFFDYNIAGSRGEGYPIYAYIPVN